MNLRASYSAGVARTESPAEKKRHPWGDLLGWLLMFAAIVLLVALATYDRRDLISNTVPANPTPRNFMGAFGASLAVSSSARPPTPVPSSGSSSASPDSSPASATCAPGVPPAVSPAS